MAKKEISDLDRLIKESEEAIARLEAAERGNKGLPLGTRIAQHLKKNSSSFINIALAGSVLVVALGRLSQKYQHEVDKQNWEEERRKLTVERNRMQEQLQAYKLSTEGLVRQMEAAAAAGGRQLAENMQGIIIRHKEVQAQLAEQQSPAVAALLHSAAAALQQQQQQQQEQAQQQQKLMV